MITRKANISLSVGDTQTTEIMLVTDLGSHDVILGQPWLKKWNPIVDWRQKVIALPEEMVIDQLQTTDGNPKELRIKLLNSAAKIPVKGSPDAAGYDLYSAEDTLVPSHGKALVDTQISMAIPNGHYGRVAPRSGLAVKHMIAVGAGVIDSDYRGSLKVLLFNLSDKDFTIASGDRIAQLIIEMIGQSTLRVVENLDETLRNDQGFGSTGVAPLETFPDNEPWLGNTGINAIGHVNPATRLTQEHVKTDE